VSIAFKLKFSTQNASLYSFSKSQICFPAFFNDSAEKRRSDKYKNEFYKLTAALENAPFNANGITNIQQIESPVAQCEI
jgi:hypothetical protein